MELSISRPKLHSGQKYVYDNLKRFNVLRNGRRWGKTILSVRLAIDTILKGGRVGYFVPSYNFSDEFWEEINDRLENIISYKNVSKLKLNFKTGGSVQIFSLEKKRAGRGKKFHRAIIDEVAFVKDMETSWTKAIRPTLTDYQGDAFFMSTPDGKNNYFYTLDSYSKEFSDWQSFHMPTKTNPFISEKEIEEIKAQLDSLTFSQEFDADYVQYNGNLFAYGFSDTRNVSNEAVYQYGLPVYLSFDFNVNPATCAVFQHTHDWIYQIDEIRLTDASIYSVTDLIKSKEYYNESSTIFVTGDASGWAREKSTQSLDSMYMIIKRELNLPLQAIKTPKANPSHKKSRILYNSIFEKHKKCIIHPKCVFSIKDNLNVKVLEDNSIDKSDSKLTHNLDCQRYYYSTFHYNFTKNVFESEE